MKTSSTSRTLLTVGLTVIAATIFTTSSEAAVCPRLVSLSSQVEVTAHRLADVVHVHYVHTRIFPRLCSEVSALRGNSAHIRRLAHNPNTCPKHLAAEIARFDNYSRKVQALIQTADDGRYGPLPGPTCGVREQMNTLNNQTHVLQAHVSNLSNPPRVDPYHNNYNSYSNNQFRNSRNSQQSYYGRQAPPTLSYAPPVSRSQPLNYGRERSVQFGDSRMWFSFR